MYSDSLSTIGGGKYSFLAVVLGGGGGRVGGAEIILEIMF